MRLRILGLLLAPAVSWAAQEAPITAVMLYPGSATIERTAAVAAGATRVEITGLPTAFDAETLRIEADPGIVVGQVVARDESLPHAASHRESELETQIESLSDQVDALAVDANAAGIERKYLERLGAPESGVPPDKAGPRLDAKSLGDVLETIRRAAADTFGREHQVALQQRALTRRIEALKEDLARLRTGEKKVRSVVVQVEARQAGRLVLSYQMRGAGWNPFYRARLDSAEARVEIDRMATVHQSTGEDWSGVRMTLFTGQPRLSPAAPEPAPWLLHYYPSAPPMTARRAEGRLRLGEDASDELQNMKVPAAVAAAPAPEGRSTERQEVVQSLGTFASEFQVPGRVDLPADGREIALALSSQTIAVHTRVRVVPRVAQWGVITAEADHLEGVWPPGRVQLLRDGSYVGATGWNPQGAEHLLLPFGRDDLIQVQVDRVHDDNGTTGVLSKRRQRHVVDAYTVTSLHKAPVDLQLLEATPVSTNEEVQVSAIYDPAPTVSDWNHKQGVVAWERTIEPRASLKFQLDYRIEFPPEGGVAGMP